MKLTSLEYDNKAHSAVRMIMLFQHASRSYNDQVKMIYLMLNMTEIDARLCILKPCDLLPTSDRRVDRVPHTCAVHISSLSGHKLIGFLHHNQNL